MTGSRYQMLLASAQSDLHRPTTSSKHLLKQSTTVLCTQRQPRKNWILQIGCRQSEARQSFYDNLIRHNSEKAVPTSSLMIGRRKIMREESKRRHLPNDVPDRAKDGGLSGKPSLSVCETPTNLDWLKFSGRYFPSLISIRRAVAWRSVETVQSMRSMALAETRRMFPAATLSQVHFDQSAGYKYIYSSYLKSDIRPMRCRRRRSDITNTKIRHCLTGKSLAEVMQKTGYPLPKYLMDALFTINVNCASAVGIFRKPGVRSRIDRFKKLIDETQSMKAALTEYNQNAEEPLSLYDLADMCKEYLRDLPETVLTSKLSPLFVDTMKIFSSYDDRLYAIQTLLLLLPDEHRIVLIFMLSLLYEISLKNNEHKMNIYNLATCFAPTIFSFNASVRMSSRRHNSSSTPAVGNPSNTSMGQTHRQSSQPFDFGFKLRTSSGNLTSSSLSGFNAAFVIEQKIAITCLSFMIENVKSILLFPAKFVFPATMTSRNGLTVRRPLIEEATPDDRIGAASDTCANYMEDCFANLPREWGCRNKRWIRMKSVEQAVTVFYRTVDDGCLLPLWCATVELTAPPEVVLYRLLRERHKWDECFIEGRVITQHDANTETFRYKLNSFPPQPSRVFQELRTWCKIRGEYKAQQWSLVCKSVISANDDQDDDMENEEPVVKSHTLICGYLFQPTACGKTRLMHISRVDMRGYSLDWYFNVYRFLICKHLSSLQKSFLWTVEGPETKV